MDWNAQASTVAITTGAAAVPPSQSYGGPTVLPPSQSYGPNAVHVIGTIVRVRVPLDPGSPGLIVVGHDGGVSRYYVTRSTVISRINTQTGAGGSVAIGALRPGDRVSIFVNPNTNVARMIRDTYLY